MLFLVDCCRFMWLFGCYAFELSLDGFEVLSLFLTVGRLRHFQVMVFGDSGYGF